MEMNLIIYLYNKLYNSNNKIDKYIQIYCIFITFLQLKPFSSV